MSTLNYRPHGRAVSIAPDVARVTFNGARTIAPGLIRARVELAGHFDIISTRMTRPRIIAQATNGAWTTWESRLLRDDEPDTAR